LFVKLSVIAWADVNGFSNIMIVIPETRQQKFKTRLVTRDFTEREGVDVFSPIVKHISIWMLLVMVVELNLEPEQMDIKIMFLYGNLE